MHLNPFHFYVVAVGAVSATIEVRASQSTSRTTAAAVDKRAGTTATVTLGPKSDYAYSLDAKAPKPSPNSFTLEPADNFNGVLLILGTDIQTKMDSTFKDKCKDAGETDCIAALQANIPTEQIALQKRQVGLIADAALVLSRIFAAVIALLATSEAGNKIKEAYHAPIENIGQAQNPTSVTAIAFTSENASPTIVPIAPSDKPKDEPTIEKNDKGGFTLHYSEDIGRKISDVLARQPHECPLPPSNNGVTSTEFVVHVDRIDPQVVRCLLAGAIAIFTALIRGDGDIGPLLRAIQDPNIIPEQQGPGARAVMQILGQQVGDMRGQLRQVNDARWNAIQRLVYYQSYHQIVLHDSGVRELTVTDEDAKSPFCFDPEMMKCDNESCKGKNGKCADDTHYGGCECSESNGSDTCGGGYVPACLNCGGDAGGNKCRGLSDKNMWKGCDCWNELWQSPPYFKTEEDFFAVLDDLLNLDDLPDNPLPPADGASDPAAAHCELKRSLNSLDAVNNLISMEKEFFRSLAGVACKDYPNDPSKSFETKLTDKDVAGESGKGYEGWSVDFKWEDKAGICDKGCTAIFEAFTGNSNCSPDSHSMAKSGDMDLSCGKASYSITPATSSTTNGTPAPTSLSPSNCPEKFPRDGSDQEQIDWHGKNLCEDRCPKTPNTPVFTTAPLYSVSGGLGFCLDRGCKQADQAVCGLK